MYFSSHRNPILPELKVTKSWRNQSYVIYYKKRRNQKVIRTRNDELENQTYPKKTKEKQSKINVKCPNRKQMD